jgi:hypothetical protein
VPAPRGAGPPGWSDCSPHPGRTFLCAGPRTVLASRRCLAAGTNKAGGAMSKIIIGVHFSACADRGDARSLSKGMRSASGRGRWSRRERGRCSENSGTRDGWGDQPRASVHWRHYRTNQPNGPSLVALGRVGQIVTSVLRYRNTWSPGHGKLKS